MLDLTGASDIIFTLLLFYILSQNFLPALEVTLPKLNQTQNQQQTGSQEIIITRAGDFKLNNQIYRLDELRKSPDSFVKDLDPDKSVKVKADHQAPAQSVLFLIELFREKGFSALNFIGLPDVRVD